MSRERALRILLVLLGLAFRPLLLHKSRKSARPSHRRVIQIEYAASPLPPPLTWHESTDT